MRCYDVDKAAEKYSLGELDYFKRKNFEKHVDSCGRCRTKYKRMIALAAILYSTASIYKPPVAKLILMSAAVKAGIAVFVAGMLMFSGSVIYKDVLADKGKIGIIKKAGVAESKEATAVYSEEKAGKKDKAASETTQSTIRVISAEGDKEVRMEIEPDTMNIKNREER